MNQAAPPANAARRRLVRSGGVLTVAALCGGAAYLVAGKLGSNARVEMESLRVALPSVPQAAVVYLAEQLGHFTAVGLDVSILPTVQEVASTNAVVRHQAEVAIAADVPFVIATLQGSPVVLLAAVTTIADDNAIVARRDRAIASPRDLEGKSVGVTPGTSSAYFLWSFLIRNNVPPESVSLHHLAPDALTQGLVSGHLDAIATWQPMPLLAQSALGLNAITFSRFDTYRTTLTAIAHPALVAQRPLAAQKFVRALLATERFMQSEPAKAIQRVAAWLHLDPLVLGASWPRFTTRIHLLQPQLGTMEDQARWAMASGAVPLQRLPNFLRNIDLRTLLAVAPDRVTILHGDRL